MRMKREVTRQFIRFCLIGLESTVLNYLVFLIMFYFLSVNYLVSSAIGFMSGVLLGFIFNKKYTFSSDRKVSSTLLKYLFVYLFSLTVQIVSLHFLTEEIALNPIISNAVLLPVTTIINFFGTKIIVFKNKKW